MTIRLFWVESRPWEAGRNVIMCLNKDVNKSILIISQMATAITVEASTNTEYDDDNVTGD